MSIISRNRTSAGNLDFLCSSVTNLFKEAEKKTAGFAKKTGLSCPRDCGDCCRDEHPEDAILALLPAARWAVDQNLAQHFLILAQNNPEGQCIFFDRHNYKHCCIYSLRPMICRLFGYAGRINKYGGLHFRSCRRLSEKVPEIIHFPPIYSDYQFRLTGLYPPLGRIYLPTNTAFIKAVEWLSLKNIFQSLSDRRKKSTLRTFIQSGGCQQD